VGGAEEGRGKEERGLMADWEVGERGEERRA